jgi:hypothetical protein
MVVAVHYKKKTIHVGTTDAEVGKMYIWRPQYDAVVGFQNQRGCSGRASSIILTIRVHGTMHCVSAWHIEAAATPRTDRGGPTHTIYVKLSHPRCYYVCLPRAVEVSPPSSMDQLYNTLLIS